MGNDKKLGVREVQKLARDIVLKHPKGIRYGEIVEKILEAFPNTPKGTVEGNVNVVTKNYPEVMKVRRGWYAPKSTNDSDVTSVESEGAADKKIRLLEKDYYPSFAEFLVAEEYATEAVPIGGNLFRGKWATPDVIGILKKKPSGSIEFPKEIIAVEIKAVSDRDSLMEAFSQAASYRLFATRSYIAIPDPEGSVDEYDRLEALCVLFGIGMFTFKERRVHEAILRSHALKGEPDIQFMEEFASRLRKQRPEVYDKLFA